MIDLNTYQLNKQHLASYIMAPLLLWLCSSVAWIQLALVSVPDSLRGKALCLVALALASLGWLFVRFFRFAGTPKAITFNMDEQRLYIDSSGYALADMKYVIVTQKNRSFAVEIEWLTKPRFAANTRLKTPLLLALDTDAVAFREAIAAVSNVEWYQVGAPRQPVTTK